MTKYSAFTICSKNYLAQAFTLKESFINHNPDKDFYIFLADTIDSSIKRYDEVVQLSTDFIPKWEEMAFKYNVIEFNTSIKPFCFNKLFNKGYERVVYLDPDIYVLESLDCVYNDLNDKDMVITPHCTHIQDEFTGAVPEEELLFVGIYNLGFCGIKKSDVGKKIVSWWMHRLEDRCYGDKVDALHVDQKWIDFLPGFYPEQIKISHHLGYNAAIWNLFERDLILQENKYFIKDKFTNVLYPLIFYHFSGFNPENPKVLNRRHPNYNIDVYPSFKPLVDQYIDKELNNGYYYYDSLVYSFQKFSNGNKILHMHRRIYGNLTNKDQYGSPFNANGKFYKLLQKKKLLSKVYNDTTAFFRASVSNKNKKREIVKKMFVLFKKLLGADRYQLLINAMFEISRNKNQSFLLGKEFND